MNYQNFAVEDFLKDDFFLEWAVHQNQEAALFWEKWMQNYPEKRKILSTAKQLATSINYQHSESLSDQDYISILETVLKETEPPGESKTRFFQINWFMKSAAAVLLIVSIVAGYLSFKKIAHDPIPQQLVTKSTPLGKKATIGLSDGSVVTLNALSHITFPTEFSENERVVQLEGEAFFEVVKDSERPFKVVTGEVETQVFGTSFNIKSDSLITDVEVALVEGSVMVSDHSGYSQVLQPYEMVKYTAESIEKRRFDHYQVIGWVSGKLVFNRATSSEVISKLERWYGVNFILESESMFDGVYSGSYINEPLEIVLNGISYTSNFKYSINDRTVTIKK